MNKLNINWHTMNQDGFYLGRTPKKLICFIEDMVKDNIKEKTLSVIDNNEYYLYLYEDCIKVNFFKNGIVEKLWFIMRPQINKCWKEI